MSTAARPATTQVPADEIFALAEHKLRSLLTTHPGRVPVFTDGGRWHIADDAWAPAWTSGFLAGLTWLVAQHTGERWWHEQAEQQSLALEHRKHDTSTHDIGFLFSPSWGRWHTAEPSDRTRDVLVTAGRTMASRYNPHGRYLSTWVDPGSTFIDVMMNIDIIYQAAELSGDEQLAEIATAHALTSRRHLVRGDGTTIHEGWFDTATGEFTGGATHQGVRADSSWVRGQAWGIYGFGSAYARTRDSRFLDTARMLAESYAERAAGRLPPNDWEDPQGELPIEVSAASIAAAGMAQLAELDTAAVARWTAETTRIVNLIANPDTMPSADEWAGLIRPATYHLRNKLGVNESVMWGDHYFLEAVARLSSIAD